MIPCYIDVFFPEVGIATLELLEKLGMDVEYPFDQTCCGQPMVISVNTIGFLAHDIVVLLDPKTSLKTFTMRITTSRFGRASTPS